MNIIIKKCIHFKCKLFACKIIILCHIFSLNNVFSVTFKYTGFCYIFNILRNPRKRNYILQIIVNFHSVIHIWLYSPLLGPAAFFRFVILYKFGRTPWTGDQPVARSLPTHRTAQTQNKRKHTSVPRVGFEPTIPVFERAKAVHASDRAVSVIG
jgi:hypothetical protein